MKPEDKEVFNALVFAGYKNIHLNNLEKLIAEEFFKAALAHRDAQPVGAQEPVGYQFRTRPAHHREKGWGSWEPCDKQLFDACMKIPVNNDLEFEVRRIYAEVPAAAINEQMLEVAGKVYELCLSGKFYDDHDKSTGLLGELRAAIRAAQKELDK